jgi:muramoyltetrapeptide carboxypeptidase
LRFAGTDDERLAQIHASADAEDVDLVMVARGGYGLSRLLDRIDWACVAGSVARGVRWVGFSDFTAFHLALLAETGAAGWAGPSVCADFGGEADPDPETLAALRQLMQGEAPAVSWPGGPAIDAAVEGPLWGGNLAMIASLAGTRWMPQVNDGILFIEDVAEHPYRVERMLLQLLHAGVLARQRAILFGDFTNWRPAAHDNGFDLTTVRDHLADRLGIPIVTGLPFGHARRHAVLGVGRRYRLESVAPDQIRLSSTA